MSNEQIPQAAGTEVVALLLCVCEIRYHLRDIAYLGGVHAIHHLCSNVACSYGFTLGKCLQVSPLPPLLPASCTQSQITRQHPHNMQVPTIKAWREHV